MSTCNQLDLETLGFGPSIAQILPGQCSMLKLLTIILFQNLNL
jgi:hypothetical protein